MYGYQSSYPEDIKTYKKVKKFEDEFDKYNPEKNLLSEEEEEVEPNSFDKEVPLKEVEYGKKIDYMQMNPIKLTDSEASMADLFKEKASGKEQ